MELIPNCSNRELILQNQLKFVINWEFFRMPQVYFLFFFTSRQVQSTNKDPTNIIAMQTLLTCQTTISISCFQDSCGSVFNGKSKKNIRRIKKKENLQPDSNRSTSHQELRTHSTAPVKGSGELRSDSTAPVKGSALLPISSSSGIQIIEI